jgi:integrase
MAHVIERTWRSGPRKAKRSAYGYTLMVNGKQERITCATWTREEAEKALAARLLNLTPPRNGVGAHPIFTFGEAIEKYLAVKAKKLSLRDDRLNLTRLRGAFGTETPLAEITAAKISDYKVRRLKTQVKREGEKRDVGNATLNRELAALRHLLRLAVEEWEVLVKAPRITLEKEPEGRIRWLEPDEEARLLMACAASEHKALAGIVTVALETGMRKGEILGLTWDRIDLSRGVIRLEKTKSGKRREMPMRQVVYEILAALPEPRSGLVWPAGGIRTAFEQAVADAKLDDFRFHDCRHHFASHFVMRGGTLQALKEILGHADLKTTLIYASLSPAHLRSEVEKTARPAGFSTTSAHDGKIEPASIVSPRKAGVAQRQSN